MAWLPYTRKYNAVELVSARRVIDDLNTVELHLFGLARFMAETRLAPEGINVVAELLKGVQKARDNVRDDIRSSEREDKS